jgi:membrane-bound lytic murein transglycosylase A
MGCPRPGALATTPPRPFDDGDRAALHAAASGALHALHGPGGAGERSAAAARGLETLVEVLDRCLAAAGSRESLDEALADSFVAQPPVSVLVTGYYEPLLRARQSPDARFRYPLYRPPEEAIARRAAASGGAAGQEAVPTRAAIDGGALSGRHLELYWTDDPIELYFLQVQGAGRLQLDDGRIVRVGFAASNGKPYRSIGAVLVERGVFRPAEATAPAIKAYLRAHTLEAPALMAENPRYVFFRAVDAPPGQGPPGSLGAPLVALRSVAVDPEVTEPGSVGRLAAQLPDGTSIAALVVAMDSGAAIKGSGRVDLFLGSGERAEAIAGELRSRGEIRWLRPSPGADGVRCASARLLGEDRVFHGSIPTREPMDRLEGES